MNIRLIHIRGKGLAGNTDDHLRNHGFIRDRSGWRLSSAYDLNPNPARRTHALLLDDRSDVSDLKTVLETAEFYRLTARAAQRIVDDVRKVTAGWKTRAKVLRIPAKEISAMEQAFSAT